MRFKLDRLDGETWRQFVERTARKYGLEHECLEQFDAAVAYGQDEAIAARDALYDWDCLELADG